MAWTNCDCQGETCIILKFPSFRRLFLICSLFYERSFVLQMLQVEKAQNTVALNEFEIEVELLSRLNNPGIIKILGWLFLSIIDSFHSSIFSFYFFTHCILISYYQERGQDHVHILSWNVCVI